MVADAGEAVLGAAGRGKLADHTRLQEEFEGAIDGGAADARECCDKFLGGRPFWGTVKKPDDAEARASDPVAVVFEKDGHVVTDISGA